MPAALIALSVFLVMYSLAAKPRLYRQAAMCEKILENGDRERRTCANPEECSKVCNSPEYLLKEKAKMDKPIDFSWYRIGMYSVPGNK